MANPAMKIIGKASTEYVDSPATLKGTITKAFGLTLVTIASAIASGVFLANSPAAYGVLILGMIVGVVLTFVTCFKPHLAPMTTPGYAVFEGAVLGIISAQFERMYFGISAMENTYYKSYRNSAFCDYFYDRCCSDFLFREYHCKFIRFPYDANKWYFWYSDWLYYRRCSSIQLAFRL